MLQVACRVYLLQFLQRLSFFKAVPHFGERENSKTWSTPFSDLRTASTLS